MRKEPKMSMYKKFSIKDTFVILLSLIALATLIFVVRYSDERSRKQQQQLVDSGDSTQTMGDHTIIQSSKDLTINEVNQAGWIEFYNKGKTMSIDLANCYITVNGVKKYTFLNTDTIGVGEYLCIEGLGRLGSSENDVIGIYDENGELLKNLLIPSLNVEESYGCGTDGGISYYCLTASKEKTNSESTRINDDILSFSVPGGFYDDSFQLEITTEKDSRIYYTLDGTEPTEQSNLYNGSILIENKSGSNMHYAIAEGIDYPYSYKPSSITMGMVVRAIAVDPTGKSSEIKTQSYFVGISKASDIKDMPILSIVTSPENLFDYFTGIYVLGRSHEDALARGEDGGASANYLNDWKKEVYVEYFEPQKDKTYEGLMSINIIKDINVTLPQKSLMLTANGGAFAGSSLSNYYNDVSNKLIVQTNKRDNTYKIREYLAQKLLDTTTVGTPDISPCVVFVNGEYWGGYMLKAEFDEAYVNKHYGVDEKDVLIARDGKVSNNWSYQNEYDELYSYIVNNDLKDEKNYTWVNAHMDVQNYLDYFCANMYLSNSEYGQNQLVMWRTITEEGSGYQDGRWRFLLPKIDNCMDNGATGALSTSSINSYLHIGVTEDLFFQSLLRNEEFKNQLYSTMNSMAENVFTIERVENYLSEISTKMKRMVEMSYKRFTGNLGDNYLREVEKIKAFFEERDKYILLYTKEVLSLGGSSNVKDDAISE